MSLMFARVNQSRYSLPALVPLAYLLTWSGAAAEQSAPPAPAPAQLVLFNGRILTVDAADSIAQAIASVTERSSRSAPTGTSCAWSAPARGASI